MALSNITSCNSFTVTDFYELLGKKNDGQFVIDTNEKSKMQTLKRVNRGNVFTRFFYMRQDVDSENAWAANLRTRNALYGALCKACEGKEGCDKKILGFREKLGLDNRDVMFKPLNCRDVKTLLEGSGLEGAENLNNREKASTTQTVEISTEAYKGIDDPESGFVILEKNQNPDKQGGKDVVLEKNQKDINNIHDSQHSFDGESVNFDSNNGDEIIEEQNVNKNNLKKEIKNEKQVLDKSERPEDLLKTSLDSADWNKVYGYYKNNTSQKVSRPLQNAIATWALIRFMDNVSGVAAIKQLSSTLQIEEKDMAALEQAYTMLKNDNWTTDHELYDNLVGEAQAFNDGKDTIESLKEKLANHLRDYLLRISQVKPNMEVKGKGVSEVEEFQSQSVYGNMCSVISMLNAMRISGGDFAKRAEGILNPKDDNGKSYYHFPYPSDKGGTKIYFDELNNPENFKNIHIHPSNPTVRWNMLLPIERAVVLALQKNGTELKLGGYMLGEALESVTAAQLLGLKLVCSMGHGEGASPKFAQCEYKVRVSEVAKALESGKPCVYHSNGHFVAISQVNINGGNPKLKVIESSVDSGQKPSAKEVLGKDSALGNKQYYQYNLIILDDDQAS